METRNLLLGAMGLLLMASCSKDELVGVNRDGDEIAFNVVTNASTRADVTSGGVYSDNNLPGKFYVWATNDDRTYIDGDEIEKAQQGNNLWVNKSGMRYWPEGTVDFYAAVNALSSGKEGADPNYVFNWNDGAPTIAITVPEAVEVQKDVLYAVNKGRSKSHEVVNLNFRHALSQVVFKAKNVNNNLYVKISGVSICKLGNSNTFQYPAETTVGLQANTKGTWVTDLTGGTQTYTVSFPAVGLAGGETKSLTADNEADKEYSDNAMLLLPQKTTRWNLGDLSSDDITGTPSQQDGTYFLVKCQIWNVAGTEGVDETTDICLWGGDGAKDIAIPIDIEWKQGQKYIYTFTFGQGTEGYDPEPTDPEVPTPILIPITFSVSVDEFDVVEKDDFQNGAFSVIQ